VSTITTRADIYPVSHQSELNQAKIQGAEFPVWQSPIAQGSAEGPQRLDGNNQWVYPLSIGICRLSPPVSVVFQMERIRERKNEVHTHRQDLHRRRCERATYYVSRAMIVGHTNNARRPVILSPDPTSRKIAAIARSNCAEDQSYRARGITLGMSCRWQVYLGEICGTNMAKGVHTN